MFIINTFSYYIRGNSSKGAILVNNFQIKLSLFQIRNYIGFSSMQFKLTYSSLLFVLLKFKNLIVSYGNA